MASYQFVQYGRLCLIEYGSFAHKAALITDILDYKTVQVEAPDVKRHVIALKSVVLTDICCKKTAPLSSVDVKHLFETEKLHDKFYASPIGKKALLKSKYDALPEPEKIKLHVLSKTKARMVSKLFK